MLAVQVDRVELSVDGNDGSTGWVAAGAGHDDRSLGAWLGSMGLAIEGQLGSCDQVVHRFSPFGRRRSIRLTVQVDIFCCCGARKRLSYISERKLLQLGLETGMRVALDRLHLSACKEYAAKKIGTQIAQEGVPVCQRIVPKNICYSPTRRRCAKRQSAAGKIAIDLQHLDCRLGRRL